MAMKPLDVWPCEQCGQLSQEAHITPTKNIIFCKNCGYRRTVDKRNSLIIENDGTVWKFDSSGNKTRVRAQ